MSELVEQFCTGLSDWSLRTGASVVDVCIFIMAATGGSKFVELELFYNPSALTIDDVKKWLEQLLSMTHMADRFLIYSLIKAYGSYLDAFFEDASKGSQRLRDAGARIRKKTNDPYIIQGTYEMDTRAALTPEKLRDRRVRRDTWWEIYASIIEDVERLGFVV